MDVELNLTTETVDQLRVVKPICVELGTSVRQVFQTLKDRAVGSVLICRDGALAGIFTERDALRLMAQGAGPAATSVFDGPIDRVMAPNPVTVQAKDTVATAIKKMSSGGYRRLPIVDSEGRPTGLVNVAGIVHYLVAHFPKAVYNLPPHPQPVLHKREGP